MWHVQLFIQLTSWPGVSPLLVPNMGLLRTNTSLDKNRLGCDLSFWENPGKVLSPFSWWGSILQHCSLIIWCCWCKKGDRMKPVGMLRAYMEWGGGSESKQLKKVHLLFYPNHFYSCLTDCSDRDFPPLSKKLLNASQHLFKHPSGTLTPRCAHIFHSFSQHMLICVPKNRRKPG